MSITTPSITYSVLYYLAFLVSLICFYIVGRKEKLPQIPWLITLLIICISFIIGTKLITLSAGSWDQLFHSGEGIDKNNKSVIGGIFLFIPFAFLSIKIFKLPRSVWSLMAWVFPLSLGIQKIGCLFAACCFGKPTSSFLGISYSDSFLPYHHHVQQGLIEPYEVLSLPVLPSPLFESLNLFIIFLIILMSREIIRDPLHHFLLMLILFFTTRFFLEFLRDPVAMVVGNQKFLGLYFLQWLLGTGTIILFLIIKSHRYLNKINFRTNHSFTNILQAAILIISLSTIVLITSSWFSDLELVTLTVVVFFALFLLIIYSYISTITLHQLITVILILILPLFLMSQMNPDSTKWLYQYKSVNTNFGTGSYVSEVLFNPQQGCYGDTFYETATFDHSFSTGSAGVSVIKENYHERLEYGGNFIYGNITEKTNTDTRHSLYGVQPYFKFDGKMLGVGGGLSLGKFYTPVLSPLSKTTVSSGLLETQIVPMAMVRVGPRRIIYGDFSFAYHIPYSFPTSQKMIGLGTGFGRFDRELAYHYIYPNGIAKGTHQVSLSFPVQEAVDIAFVFTGNDDASAVNLGFKYRFNKKGQSLKDLNYFVEKTRDKKFSGKRSSNLYLQIVKNPENYLYTILAADKQPVDAVPIHVDTIQSASKKYSIHEVLSFLGESYLHINKKIGGFKNQILVDKTGNTFIKFNFNKIIDNQNLKFHVLVFFDEGVCNRIDFKYSGDKVKEANNYIFSAISYE